MILGLDGQTIFGSQIDHFLVLFVRSREDKEKGDPLTSSSGPRLSGLTGLSIEDVAVTSDDDDDLINDDAFLACDDVMEATVSSLSPSKSPTQSVRSLLSRPRSTPMRRATVS